MAQRTWTAGSGQLVPDDLTGVCWHDGTIECRFLLVHPTGSIVAFDGDVGVVLTNSLSTIERLSTALATTEPHRC